MKYLFTLLAFSFVSPLVAQTLFTPGGAVGTSSNGNVGIGTNGPSELLHLSRNNANAHLVIDAQSSGSGDAALRLVRNGLNTEELRIIAAAGGASGQNNAYLFDTIGNSTARDIIFRTSTNGGGSYSETLRLTSAGNLGIGTSSPTALIHAKGGAIKLESGIMAFPAIGSSLVTGEIHGGANSGTDAGFLRLSAGGETTANVKAGIDIGGYLTGDPAVGYGAVRIWGGNSSGSPTEIARFINGNVGIGTTTPSHKLAVNGAIRAKEVIVDTGWADYVFASDYRLAPLSEVEAHIQAKKHLPGIPSAAEVEAQGVSIGEMQSKLLAKIEELVLYQIAQEKRGLEQEKQIADVRSENEQLHLRIKELERKR